MYCGFQMDPNGTKNIVDAEHAVAACGGVDNYDFGCTNCHNFSAAPTQEEVTVRRNWWGTNATFTLRLKWDRKYVGDGSQRAEFLGQIGADVAASVGMSHYRVQISRLLDADSAGASPELSQLPAAGGPVKTVTVSGTMFGGWDASEPDTYSGVNWLKAQSQDPMSEIYKKTYTRCA
jgi:hypothetical protein